MIDDWFRSNPSIAAGSHELYLGHRFVGIPRVRAMACEPQYYGSYLLASLPFVLAAWSTASGRLRAGLGVASGLGLEDQGRSKRCW